MSWNNVTPWWMMCNPYKIPRQQGYYYWPPDVRAKRAGPFDTYEQAVEGLLAEGGKVTGRLEWLE